jgi:hypothetical protein
VKFIAMNFFNFPPIIFTLPKHIMISASENLAKGDRKQRKSGAMTLK